MPSPADSARYLRLHRAWLASLDPEHQAALAPLPDPDPAWGHMGLVPSPASILAPSTLNDDPAIRAMLATGAPPSFDLSPRVLGIYDQNGTGSCASAARSGTQSIAEQEERAAWIVFDLQRLYTEIGGVGNSGSTLEDNLNHSINPGVPVLGSAKRYAIDSWSYAPKTSLDAWINSIKAAIAAGRPVMVATLLQ